jgi:hypothetical protein
MFSLSLEEAVSCLLTLDQIRLKSSLAHLKVEDELTINLLIESYLAYFDQGDYCLSLAATPDCNASHLLELILEKYQLILPKKYKITIASSINKLRRSCWDAIAHWREWRFKELFEKGRIKAPFLLIKQAEYLKSNAIQELRDLNSRLSVPVLMISDRPLKRTVEMAEGQDRFIKLNYPLLLKDGLEQLKAEITARQLKSQEEYYHLFEPIIQKSLIQENSTIKLN